VPYAAPSRYGACWWGLGVGRLVRSRRLRNCMDGPLWRRLFVAPARITGEAARDGERDPDRLRTHAITDDDGNEDAM
jgi:hypothetical protein